MSTVPAPLPDASPTARGAITTGDQSIAGRKTFQGGIDNGNTALTGVGTPSNGTDAINLNFFSANTYTGLQEHLNPYGTPLAGPSGEPWLVTHVSRMTFDVVAPTTDTLPHPQNPINFVFLTTSATGGVGPAVTLVNPLPLDGTIQTDNPPGLYVIQSGDGFLNILNSPGGGITLKGGVDWTPAAGDVLVLAYIPGPPGTNTWKELART
jgi:hypothetical protein